jgi:hypothetical protein
MWARELITEYPRAHEIARPQTHARRQRYVIAFRTLTQTRTRCAVLHVCGYAASTIVIGQLRFRTFGLSQS